MQASPLLPPLPTTVPGDGPSDDPQDQAIDGLGEAVHALLQAWSCVSRQGAESTRTWLSGLQLAMLIGTGEHRLSELAERRGVDQSVISRQVGIMQAHGLVCRRPDPADGRASLVRLTAAGHELLENGRAMRRRWLRDALARTDSGDVRTATTLITALTRELRAHVTELTPQS